MKNAKRDRRLEYLLKKYKLLEKAKEAAYKQAERALKKLNQQQS